MIIGIDFDNTIACHDQSFRKIILDEGLSIETRVKPKQVVKDFFLGKDNGNLEWTRIQGKVYGSDISSAELFDGFLPFLEEAKSFGHKLLVISHRTRFPAWGKEIDLHKAALQWLSGKGLLSHELIPLENCFFETTLEKKIERIGIENCYVFIDDLAQVLGHSMFPRSTKKVLFGQPHESLPFFSHWKEAKSLLIQDPTEPSSKPSKRIWSTLPPDQHQDCFRKLLQKAEKGELTAMEQVKRGGNNCVYKIELGDEAVLGKVYHRDTRDSRDRLGQEVAFAQYLESMQIKEIPALIAEDRSSGAVCFDWIEGREFDSGFSLSDDYWKQCFSFLKRIQEGRNSIEAHNLPNGSEAAFSFRDHFAFLQNRRDYWLSHSDSQTIPAEIRNFLSNDLDREYKKVARELISHSDFNKELETTEKIISPSDFGLHNAKLHEDGQLGFFDFEYAGWDDPAKTIADFFAQPRFTPPPEEFPAMLSTFSGILSSQVMERLLRRLPLVDRIIRLKWCYILLNDFHPVSSKRRILSGKKPNSEEQILKLMNGFVNTSPLLTNSL